MINSPNAPIEGDTFTYGRLVPVLTKAIQELSAKLLPSLVKSKTSMEKT